MTAHDDAKIAEILGYSAEVCEPDSTAYYTSRHLDPVRKRLVEYVESVRADERERIVQSVRALWHEQCSGYQSMSCESCRAYDDVLTYAIARGGEQP